jgi:RNA polymerase sigma factor (sigma-70 family)
MTAGIIDESAIAEALRLSHPGERARQILSLQGLGLWHGDLAEMRRDSPRRPIEEPGETSPNTTEAASRMMMVLRVKAALKQLPPREREALRLHYDEGLRLEEIAERLGVKTGYAEVLINRALQHVSKIYIDSVGGHAEAAAEGGATAS